MNNDQREAMIRLEEIKDELDTLSNEASELVRHNFPEYMSWAEAYGIFRLVDSGNPYDNTFEKLLEYIERDDQEGRWS